MIMQHHVVAVISVSRLPSRMLSPACFGIEHSLLRCLCCGAGLLLKDTDEVGGCGLIMPTGGHLGGVRVAGLDNAGKTTTLYQLHLGQAVVSNPTVGSNVEQVKHRNLTFEVGAVVLHAYGVTSMLGTSLHRAAAGCTPPSPQCPSVRGIMPTIFAPADSCILPWRDHPK